MRNTALKIRRLRKNRNLTQEYLADRLSMSVKTYQRLESGKIALTLQQGMTLAQVLDAALEEFFPEIKPAVPLQPTYLANN